MKLAKTCAAFAVATVTALPSAALAQSAPPSSPTVQNRWPDPPKPPGARPPAAAAQAAPQSVEPPATSTHAAVSPKAEEALEPAKPKPKAAPAVSSYAVTCNGVFAKDSTHLKLAVKYDSKNVVFGQVDGPEGSKIPASILFPNDPKRRLEVVWSNDAARADTQVIAINGKSQWAAPKGVKLGVTLAALEKANGKPFKISGFGADGSASVVGWEGGALSALPGGCKLGVRLFEDPKSPEAARKGVTGDKEILSTDASLQAVKPKVGEILIGY